MVSSSKERLCFPPVHTLKCYMQYSQPACSTHSLHTVDDVRKLSEVTLFQTFSSFCIPSSSEWPRSLKVDLKYQMRAHTPFTISCKPCRIYDSCSLLRFQQSTTPYSLLMDYRQHTFHQETAAAEEMPGRLTTRNKISRKSRAAVRP